MSTESSTRGNLGTPRSACLAVQHTVRHMKERTRNRQPEQSATGNRGRPIVVHETSTTGADLVRRPTCSRVERARRPSRVASPGALAELCDQAHRPRTTTASNGAACCRGRYVPDQQRCCAGASGRGTTPTTHLADPGPRIGHAPPARPFGPTGDRADDRSGGPRASPLPPGRTPVAPPPTGATAHRRRREPRAARRSVRIDVRPAGAAVRSRPRQRAGVDSPRCPGLPWVRRRARVPCGTRALR